MQHVNLTSEKKDEYYSKKLPEDIPSLLLSSFYVGEKRSVFLKFYNPSDSQVYFWSESFVHSTNSKKHQPYCFVKKKFEVEARRVYLQVIFLNNIHLFFLMPNLLAALLFILFYLLKIN